MILCKDLNSHRLGNALFKIAFAKALALRLNNVCLLPKWKYKQYFNLCWAHDGGNVVQTTFYEPNFDYSPVIFENKDTDYRGYWQSFRYFADVWDKMKDEFKWNEEFLASIWERTNFRPSSTDIACHVRLTDYQSNSNYIQIPASYYTEFFDKNPNLNYYVFSDDMPAAKCKLGTWKNVQYVEGSEDIEDMALMSQFSNLLISNSTFSWWSAHLATLVHDTVNVVRPDGLFSGELAKTCTGKDFYQPQWTVKPIHSFKLVKNDKIDLKDCTFVSVIKIDSEDRRNNLRLMLEYLLKHYDTNIIIGENFTHECEWVATLPNVRYIYFDEFDFHRTKFLNELFKMSETEIVVNHDVDILIPVPQMEEAVRLIRDEYDFVYPYEEFLRVAKEHYPKIKASLDTRCLKGREIKGTKTNSVGGCVLARRRSHFQVGGENEHYFRFGREDVSRHLRYMVFGKCTRVSGPLYHIEHFIGPDSSSNHDYAAINLSEARKELKMTKEQLQAYLNSWPQTIK